MAMREAILKFSDQFRHNPDIKNQDNLKSANSYIIAGMGGSNHAAGLLKIHDPKLDLLIHHDYGLPRVPDYFLTASMIILSSYSGNTEEVIDTFHAAGKMELNRAVMTTGGKLLELAQAENVPYIQMVSTGIQPRSALGFSIMTMLRLIGNEGAIENLMTLHESLDPTTYEAIGKSLAEKLADRTPVIYSSTRNLALASISKIKFNETGKIPAFYNIFPELNHNEMTGFDPTPSAGETGQASLMQKRLELNSKFFFIFLKDSEDDPRLQKRMDITAKLYTDRGLPVEIINMQGASQWEKIFSTLLIADWAALYTAEHYGLESEQVPMVEEFKGLIQ